MNIRCIALLSIGVLCSTAAHAETLRVGDIERHYIMTPAKSASTPRPLLLVLHGLGGSAAQVQRSSGFDEMLALQGVHIVYPEGIDNRWADLRQLTLKSDARSRVDDVGFIAALVKHLVATGIADPQRVYIAGHSNGGFMAITMACAHAELFAGFAAVAASLPKTGTCKPARAIAGLLFADTDDPLIPFAGGGIGRQGARGFVMSSDDTAAAFAAIAQCKTVDKSTRLHRESIDQTTVVIENHEGCTAPLRRYIISGGGHGWPGRGGLLKATKQIDATAEIASFFGLAKERVAPVK